MSEADVPYSVELEMFEGPLDLLLHLVRKHELNIIDIPISFVTRKYLEYLDAWAKLDVDVAADYLVMAATLCHIKSRELLPKDAVAEEVEEIDAEDTSGVDPRAELIRRLLEYQKYKEAALHLGDRPVVGRNVWVRGSDVEEAVSEDVSPDLVSPLVQFPVSKLMEAFERLVKRVKLKVTHNVVVDRLSVSQRIAELATRLEQETRVTFSSLFTFLRDGREVTADELRHEAVVTLLAILELGKLRLIRIFQDAEPPEPMEGEEPQDAEIMIERASDDIRARVSENVAGADTYA